MTRLNNLVFIATTLYFFLDRFLGIHVALYVYIGFYLFGITNYLLIRYNQLEISKIFGLTAFNILIFIISTSEPFTTGMHLQFVTSGAVALALYGYEQWKGAIFFVSISLILDIITFTVGIPLIPWRDVVAEQARVFFILNTLIAASVSIYVFMLTSKINLQSQQALLENDNTIKAQNDQLLKTNAELDRFVYSASHDLRSPLSTLRGLINLTKIETDQNLKKEYLEMMNDRIKAMDGFISEIIDYSRNSRLKVGFDIVNMNDLLTTVCDDLKYLEGRNGVSIYCDVDESLTIRSDLSRLKMVFTNLITNAIKYRDLNKEEQWIRLKGQTVDNRAEIKVEDNGIGIDANLTSMIFDMFFRAHDHATGSGLGLYIVKEALDKLSGTIAVESHLGKGSEFVVSLPLARS